MADMDLDDLAVPNQAPTRPGGRFAPKGSKFQPKPKTAKTEPPPSSSSSGPELVQPKKEEFDSKPQLGIDSASVENDTVAMDIDAKVEEEEGDTHAMEMEDDDEEEEDRVVREIDVFFTPSIDDNTKLYVVQYPLRPVWRPYDLETRCKEVRVKPKSGEVEVDLAVDVDSKNYDRNADPKLRITKETLKTPWVPSTRTGYAIGVLTGDELHLNPIHVVVQLRPSLEHLNPGGPKKRIIAGDDTEVSVKAEEPEQGKPIVPLRNQNKKPGEPSKQNENIEKWVPLKYHDARSGISARYLQKMIEKESTPIQFTMSSHDYLNNLCPITSSGSLKPDGLSKRPSLSLPLEERYKCWLVEGPSVHRFDALKYHLGPDESVEDMLGVLQKYAQLVQGLWVPKSSLLQYEKDQEMHKLARDFILLQFSKSILISTTQLPHSPQLLVNAMKTALNDLAVERPSLNDWKFKEPQDTKFIKHHPEIVKEQEQVWERLEKHIYDFFARKNITGMKSSSKTNNAAALKSSIKVESKTSNGSLSRKPMSDESREALPRALQKVLQQHKVCSFPLILQSLRGMALSEFTHPKGSLKAVTAAKCLDDVPQEEVQAIISQVAINIHGVYVSRSSSDHPQYDDLRKIVIDLLIAEGPDAKLKKASIFEAAKLQLKRDINNNEYQKVLQELCVSKGSAWVLRSGDGNPN